MHWLECGQGTGEHTHPVNQKQHMHSRAGNFSSGAQVSLILVSRYTDLNGSNELENTVC